MTKIGALAWKEYRQLRWFFIIGMFIFIGLPMTEVLRKKFTNYSDSFSGLVLALGGVWAIFVAVAACRDLSHNLLTFWISRPLGLFRWFAAKYLAGLTAVLIICLSPLFLHMYLHRSFYPDIRLNNFSQGILYYHTFTIILVYSVAFLSAVLVRQAAQAAILSLAIGLLIYFLPMLIKPLNFLSVLNLIEEFSIYNLPEHVYFFWIMLAASALTAALSGIALKKNWRLKFDKRLIVWSLGIVVLLLFAATASELGSNLKCEKQIPIQPANAAESRSVARIILHQDKGVLLLHDRISGWIYNISNYSICSFDLSAPEAGITPETTTHTDAPPDWGNPGVNTLLWSADYPGRAYLMIDNDLERRTRGLTRQTALWTIDLKAPPEETVINKMDLLSYFPNLSKYEIPKAYLLKNIIYIYGGSQLLLIDIVNPGAPEITQTIPTKDFHLKIHANYRTLGLLPLDDLAPTERFDVSFNLVSKIYAHAWQNDLYVFTDTDYLITYRIEDQTKNPVKFTEIARRRISSLRQLAGWYPTQMVLDDQFVYILNRSVDFGGLTVFDVRDPRRPRRIGYYAAPNEYFYDIATLPDDRILLGGDKLHIVNPPKLEK